MCMAGTYPGWSEGYCPGFLPQTPGSLAQVFEISVGFIRTFPPKSCRQNTPPAGPGSPWAPTQISCRCSGTGYEMCALALCRSSLAATDACTAEIWGMMFTRASWHFSLICKPRSSIDAHSGNSQDSSDYSPLCLYFGMCAACVAHHSGPCVYRASGCSDDATTQL